MILAAAAALTLAGCAKVETYKVSENDGQIPIGFANYSPKAVTRAGDTYINGATLISGKTFAVYAWKTAYGAFLGVNPGAPAFMNPAVVTYNDDNTTGEGNTYTPVRYWPAGDEPENLSFTAYYPAGGAGITAPTFTSGVGTYAFTAQAAAADMVDFCVADVVNDQVYGKTNASPTYAQTVKFTFRHQLTKVQVKFKTTEAVENDANTEIKITAAKFCKINNAGTLTATYAQNASPAVNAPGTTTTAWSAQSGAATYDVAFPTTALTKTASTVADADIFLMVPQTMLENTDANAQYLEITWTVTTDGVPTTNTKKLYLDDCVTSDSGTTAANIDWVKNNCVTYTITVGPKPIWFTAEVAPWNPTEQNGYFNVQ